MRLLSDKRGFTLMMTIWVVVFLTIVAMSFSFSTRLSTAMTVNFRDETLAYYGALSAYHTVLMYLASDRDPTVDFVDEQGRFFLDLESGPIPEMLDIDQVSARVSVVDEESKINLNRTNQIILSKIFKRAGVDTEKVDALRDSLLDWVDPDDAHRLNGAEDEYYREFGYTAKNARLDLPRELLLVKGFREDFFKGRDPGELVAFITTFGTGGLNINTAPRSLLSLLGLDDNSIETVMVQRNETMGGFRFIPADLSRLGLTRTASSYLRIGIEGRLKGGKTGYRITAVIRRMPSPKGFRFRILYWEEDVSYGYNKA